MLKHREIALALLAEAEIVTDHEVAYAKAARQDVLDELLGGMGGERCIEARHEDAVDAAGIEQQQLRAGR